MKQQSFQNDTPKLYIVSTPIGNLKDISYRAVEILSTVKRIYAEDTRNSGVLLKHYAIDTPLRSYHEHNKHEGVRAVLEDLENLGSVALISDAGTPLISDPGSVLVDQVIQAGFHVVPVPGASAILSALVVSNLNLESFSFFGFLPRKETEIKTVLKRIKNDTQTLIFYESPFRVLDTLKLMYEVFGPRKVTIIKEMTKSFETVIWTTLSNDMNLDVPLKGEFVMVVEGKDRGHHYELEEAIDQVRYLVSLGVDEKIAMKEVSQKMRVKKQDIYQAIKVIKPW